MFDDKSSWIGIGLLVLCGISAGTMLGYIEAGERIRYTGPAWLGLLIIVAFMGLVIFGAIRTFKGRTFGDDVRSDRPWWRRDKE